MMKTTVYLDAETVLSLRHMAESQGRSQADLIRDALETYTRRGKRPRLRGLGKYDSGKTNISEKAEDILREASKKGKWR
jgi:predicted transcriptional regulator